MSLRILVFTIQTFLGSGVLDGCTFARELVFVAVVLFHGLLLVWQIVGVVRAAEFHFASRGNMALVWGAQLGAVLFFVLSIIYVLEAIQTTMMPLSEQDPLASIELERATQYSLSLDSSERQLSIDGSIELGITKAV